MKGSIRMAVGFMMVFVTVGSMDYNPDASLFVLVPLACVGLVLMVSGSRAIKNG